jgi:hypothetical protein
MFHLSIDLQAPECLRVVANARRRAEFDRGAPVAIPVVHRS